MTIELISHKIFAENLILGESLFLTMKLPPTWDLAPGVSRPEVYATHERKSRKWVASGDAWYVIYQKQQNWALELAITTRPIKDGHGNSTGDTVNIGGHTAMLRWQEKQRGLPWQRHSVTFMTVEFACPASERRLKLEFSGWCPEAGFHEVLGSLKNLRCH